MTSPITKNNTLLISAMIIAAVLCRLATNEMHLYNFSPIAIIALFAGANFKDKKFAFIVPVIAMLITDYFIGFWHLMWVVYGCFALTTFLGFALRNNKRWYAVGSAALFSSILFFLITNFAVFVGNPLYPQNLSGLMMSYAAGLPFFKNQIAGDLFYTSVLFGGYALIMRRENKLEIASEKNIS